MADNTSTVSFRADISNLQKGMQQAARQVRLAESEFKAATAGMDSWEKSADGLNAKLKSLSSVLTAQKSKLSLLEDELERTVREYGENSAAADRVRIRINNQTAAIQRTERELNQYESELRDVTNDANRFDDALEELNSETNTTSGGFSVMKDALGDLVADGIRMAVDALKDLAEQTVITGASFEQGMAQVEAISGASAEEVAQLTEKAKEMGESTKFSATEASEAFNYMAMAGWETEDMLSGIEGIMNLAAASGEDLATTSDIVTDALTAMGYSAGDAGKLADVMAAASSNANTNVKLMGSTFQYAAPILGTLGMSMEDAAVAIGLMANAGIKGDKAGTALRSTLTRLSAPPKECATEMEKLGISIENSDGTMRSLDEIIRDLRESMSGLSETEQTAAAKHIAGQQSMAGLLAIVNASEEDYQKLTEAVRDSEGAAQSMADTMNDTVSGQATLLKSKIEGIMIKIFEKIAPTIREAMDEASAALDKVNWDNVGDKVVGFFKKIKELYDFLKQNSDKVKGLISGVIAAFAVTKIAAIVSSIVSLVGTFRTLATAISAASTATEVFTALQAATPIGLVTTALAALVGVVTAYTVATKSSAGEVQVLTEKENDLIKSISEETESYKGLKEERDKATSDASSQFEYYRELADELEDITDKNGKIKKGYEDRADFIVTTLNDALGTEISATDGVIENYKKQQKEIYNLIEAKKAEAVMNANEALYTQAINNRYKAFTQMEQAQDAFAESQKETAKATNELKKAQQDYDNAIKNTGDATIINQYKYKLDEATEAVTGAVAKQKELQKTYEDSKNTYQGYISTIENYEGTAAAIQSGDTKKIIDSLQKLQNGFLTAETADRESLERQVENYKKIASDYKKAIEDGTPGVTQAMVEQSEKLVKDAKKELKKLPDEASKIGKQAGTYYAVGVGSQSDNAKNKSAAVASSSVAGLKSQNSEANVAGQGTGSNYASGVSSQTDPAKASGSAVASSAKTGLESENGNAYQSGVNFARGFQNGIIHMAGEIGRTAASVAQSAIDQVRKTQKEASPSKETYKSGVNFSLGYSNGIVSKKETIKNAATSVATYALSALSNASAQKGTSYSIGVDFYKKIINGISDAQDSLGNFAKKISEKTIKTILSPESYQENSETVLTDFSNSFSKKINYITEKYTYKNNLKMASLADEIQKMEEEEEERLEKISSESEKNIKKLETARDKNVKRLEAQKKKTNDANEKKRIDQSIKNTKKYYDDLINVEKKESKKQANAIKKQYDAQIGAMKDFEKNYQEASNALLQNLQTSLSEYQQAAESLILSTINGIYDKYDEKYNDLLQKQDDLTEKLKNAGSLFEISNAGVITVNDIKKQTQKITEYVGNLQNIKGKVSSALYDEIVTYDMEQGNAFIKQLLKMSDSELQSYSDAFDEKMKISEEYAAEMYQDEFEKASKEYTDDMTEAMSTLPDKLNELGKKAIQGLIDGMTTDTDYMSKGIKSIVSSMVSELKKNLEDNDVASMTQIGTSAGVSFLSGFANTIQTASQKISDFISDTGMPINGISSGFGNFLADDAIYGTGSAKNTVTNNYNLVQNNTSPKSLSALDTYQARRQQMALLRSAILQ